MGLIANHYFQIPIELFAAVFNITMFILAIVVLGKSFALTSLISTFYFPVILGVFQKVEVLRHLTDDLMLCTIFPDCVLESESEWSLKWGLLRGNGYSAIDFQ